MQNEPSHLTQAILAEMDALSKVVADDVAQRSRAKRAVTRLLKAVQQNDVDAAARLLRSRGQEISEKYPQAKSTFEKVRIDLKRRQEDQLRHTYAQLEEHCRAEGIALKGRPPKYVVDHLLEVEFDRNAGRTKVGIQSLTTFKWPSILEALEAERARVWQRPFDGGDFRDRLVRAYQELERVNPSPTGWASLEEIYQILKRQIEDEQPDWRKGGRLVAYYKDEFSADLSMLWRAQASNEIDSPHVELSAVRDPRRQYKMVQPDHNVGLYGFLRPREV